MTWQLKVFNALAELIKYISFKIFKYFVKSSIFSNFCYFFFTFSLSRKRYIAAF